MFYLIILLFKWDVTILYYNFRIYVDITDIES